MSDMRRLLRLVENTQGETGNAPGIWYHGTPYMFDQFDVNAGEFDSQHETPAIFLTNDPDLAGAYASREREPIRSDGLPWATYKAEFIDPLTTILQSSTSPSAAFLANFAEGILNGQWDAAKVMAELPDIAPQVGQIIRKLRAREMENSTTMGANIRPVQVRGRYMHIHLFRDFNGAQYDLCMRQAKESGLDGVLFHNIVDTPSGTGDPADILAVFDGRNIMSRFGMLRDLANKA